jgi:hypothetical protein
LAFSTFSLAFLHQLLQFHPCFTQSGSINQSESMTFDVKNLFNRISRCSGNITYNRSFFFSKALSKVDFPAFGFPMMATAVPFLMAFPYWKLSIRNLIYFNFI